MTRRRPHIPVRRLVFVGCEGQSELAYVGLLQDFLHDADIPVHLVNELLGPGAGDPLTRVEMAVRKLTHLRRTRTAPAQRFVLLDFDQAERDPVRAQRAERLAAQNQIAIIWQRPCFEAVLLRHLPNRAAHQPPDTQAVMRLLELDWPQYAKPMNRIALGRRIDLEAVHRAAAVEPTLADLLRCIGLLPL